MNVSSGKSTIGRVKVFIASQEDIAEVRKNRFYMSFILKNPSNSIVFVARDLRSGQIRGYAIAEQVAGKRFLEIKRMSTRRGYSGAGIGRKILARVQSYALKNNFNLYVVSSPTPGARNFWKAKAKFRPVPNSEKTFGEQVSFFKKVQKIPRTRKK